MNLQQALVIILAELDKRKKSPHSLLDFWEAEKIAAQYVANENEKLYVAETKKAQNRMFTCYGVWTRRTGRG
jgi:hypothetical protein